MVQFESVGSAEAGETTRCFRPERSLERPVPPPMDTICTTDSVAALDLAGIGLNERDKIGVIEQIAEIIILECQLAIFGIQLDSLL